MEEEKLYSQKIRCGKHTYFFDVMRTLAGVYWINIKEITYKASKEKVYRNKVNLYPEDFHKFTRNLQATIKEAELMNIKEVEDGTTQKV